MSDLTKELKEVVERLGIEYSVLDGVSSVDFGDVCGSHTDGKSITLPFETNEMIDKRLNVLLLGEES